MMINFGSVLKKLSWGNKSEFKCSSNNLMNLERNNLNFVMCNIDKYASALLDVVDSDLMINFN